MFLNFEKIAGLITAAFISLYAIGRPDLAWKAIAHMRYYALHETSKSWGCPSAFNRGACSGYDPSRYKK